MNKPGIKTTEFWIGLGAILLAYFNENLGLNLPVESILAVSAIVVSYIASRTYIKKNN